MKAATAFIFTILSIAAFGIPTDFFTPPGWNKEAPRVGVAWYWPNEEEMTSKGVYIGVDGNLIGLDTSDFESAEGKTALNALKAALASQAEIEQLNQSLNDILDGGLYVDIKSASGVDMPTKVKYRGGDKTGLSVYPRNSVSLPKVVEGDGITVRTEGVADYRIGIKWPGSGLFAATSSGWEPIMDISAGAVDGVSLETNKAGRIEIKGFSDFAPPGGLDLSTTLTSSAYDSDGQGSWKVLARSHDHKLKYITIGRLPPPDDASIEYIKEEDGSEKGAVGLVGFANAETYQIPYIGDDGFLGWMDPPRDVEYDDDANTLTITDIAGGDVKEVPLSDVASLDKLDLEASQDGEGSSLQVRLKYTDISGESRELISDAKVTQPLEVIQGVIVDNKSIDSAGYDLDKTNAPVALQIKGFDAGAVCNEKSLAALAAPGSAESSRNAHRLITRYDNGSDIEIHYLDIGSLPYPGSRHFSYADGNEGEFEIKAGDEGDVLTTSGGEVKWEPSKNVRAGAGLDKSDDGVMSIKTDGASEGQVMTYSGGVPTWMDATGASTNAITYRGRNGMEFFDNGMISAVSRANFGAVSDWAGPGIDVYAPANSGGGVGKFGLEGMGLAEDGTVPHIKMYGESKTIEWKLPESGRFAVTGTDGVRVEGTNIVFQSAQDSNVEIKATGHNGVITLTIGVYYK